MVGLVRGRGRGAVRVDGGRAGEPRGASDCHRARVPTPALAARAGQRPAPAVAARTRSPARDRARGQLSSRASTAPARGCRLLTAGIVNLVPEGLILLISLTAAVSAFKIAQRGVLAQQLNAVESLASVDVVCTDKTGTLTEAALRVVGLVPAEGVDQADARRRARELRRERPVSQPRPCRRSRTRGWPTPRRAPWSRRCRSRPAGAGVRSTLATSASCSARRNDSRPPTRRSPSVRGRRRAPGGACSRSGVRRRRCRPAARTRRFRRTCAPSVSSCCARSSGPTQPTPWRSSPPRTSS